MHVYEYLYVCRHACMLVCMYVCMHVLMHMLACTGVRMYTLCPVAESPGMTTKPKTLNPKP